MGDTFRKPIRARKGDLLVVLNDGQNEIKVLLKREKVTEAHRAVVAKMQNECVSLLLGGLPSISRGPTPPEPVHE